MEDVAGMVEDVMLVMEDVSGKMEDVLKLKRTNAMLNGLQGRVIRVFACGIQQALACVFPVLVFSSLALSHLFAYWLPRYDFMLLMCVLIQVVLYLTKIETKDEVLVICVFHGLGLVMELFKVHCGSWQYPEAAYTKFFSLPLYSGFMYASVASYMCQAWRRLDLQIINWPNHKAARLAGALIYINFFSNHFIYDVRYVIGLLVIYLFRSSVVLFRVQNRIYRMPVILSFILIGFFIWLGEKYCYPPWRLAICLSAQKLAGSKLSKIKFVGFFGDRKFYYCCRIEDA